MLVYGQARTTLRGLVTDELGAAIVGVNVTLTDASGNQKKTTTNQEGVYTFSGLTPGKYTISAAATGFAVIENREVDLAGQRQTLDLTLKVTIEEKVTMVPSKLSVPMRQTTRTRRLLVEKISMLCLTIQTN